MLKKDYFCGSFRGVCEDFEHNAIYIVYPFSMVKLLYTRYGWSCVFYGECMYSLANGLIELCKRLDPLYNYNVDNA